ncbi:hypothetical protein IAR50_005632 [Cryptococcus sp. DSM 104548]
MANPDTATREAITIVLPLLLLFVASVWLFSRSGEKSANPRGGGGRDDGGDRGDGGSHDSRDDGSSGPNESRQGGGDGGGGGGGGDDDDRKRRKKVQGKKDKQDRKDQERQEKKDEEQRKKQKSDREKQKAKDEEDARKKKACKKEQKDRKKKEKDRKEKEQARSRGEETNEDRARDQDRKKGDRGTSSRTGGLESRGTDGSDDSDNSDQSDRDDRRGGGRLAKRHKASVPEDSSTESLNASDASAHIGDDSTPEKPSDSHPPKSRQDPSNSPLSTSDSDTSAIEYTAGGGGGGGGDDPPPPGSQGRVRNVFKIADDISLAVNSRDGERYRVRTSSRSDGSDFDDAPGGGGWPGGRGDGGDGGGAIRIPRVPPYTTMGPATPMTPGGAQFNDLPPRTPAPFHHAQRVPNTANTPRSPATPLSALLPVTASLKHGYPVLINDEGVDPWAYRSAAPGKSSFSPKELDLNPQVVEKEHDHQPRTLSDILAVPGLEESLGPGLDPGNRFGPTMFGDLRRRTFRDSRRGSSSSPAVERTGVWGEMPLSPIDLQPIYIQDSGGDSDHDRPAIQLSPVKPPKSSSDKKKRRKEKQKRRDSGQVRTPTSSAVQVRFGDVSSRPITPEPEEVSITSSAKSKEKISGKGAIKDDEEKVKKGTKEKDKEPKKKTKKGDTEAKDEKKANVDQQEETEEEEEAPKKVKEKKDKKEADSDQEVQQDSEKKAEKKEAKNKEGSKAKKQLKEVEVLVEDPETGEIKKQKVIKEVKESDEEKGPQKAKDAGKQKKRKELKDKEEVDEEDKNKSERKKKKKAKEKKAKKGADEEDEEDEEEDEEKPKAKKKKSDQGEDEEEERPKSKDKKRKKKAKAEDEGNSDEEESVKGKDSRKKASMKPKEQARSEDVSDEDEVDEDAVYQKYTDKNGKQKLRKVTVDVQKKQKKQRQQMADAGQYDEDDDNEQEVYYDRQGAPITQRKTKQQRQRQQRQAEDDGSAPVDLQMADQSGSVLRRQRAQGNNQQQQYPGQDLDDDASQSLTLEERRSIAEKRGRKLGSNGGFSDRNGTERADEGVPPLEDEAEGKENTPLKDKIRGRRDKQPKVESEEEPVKQADTDKPEEPSSGSDETSNIQDSTTRGEHRQPTAPRGRAPGPEIAGPQESNRGDKDQTTDTEENQKEDGEKDEGEDEAAKAEKERIAKLTEARRKLMGQVPGRNNDLPLLREKALAPSDKTLKELRANRENVRHSPKRLNEGSNEEKLEDKDAGGEKRQGEDLGTNLKDERVEPINPQKAARQGANDFEERFRREREVPRNPTDMPEIIRAETGPESTTEEQDRHGQRQEQPEQMSSAEGSVPIGHERRTSQTPLKPHSVEEPPSPVAAGSTGKKAIEQGTVSEQPPENSTDDTSTQSESSKRAAAALKRKEKAERERKELEGIQREKDGVPDETADAERGLVRMNNVGRRRSEEGAHESEALSNESGNDGDSVPFPTGSATSSVETEARSQNLIRTRSSRNNLQAPQHPSHSAGFDRILEDDHRDPETQRMTTRPRQPQRQASAAEEPREVLDLSNLTDHELEAYERNGTLPAAMQSSPKANVKSEMVSFEGRGRRGREDLILDSGGESNIVARQGESRVRRERPTASEVPSQNQLSESEISLTGPHLTHDNPRRPALDTQAYQSDSDSEQGANNNALAARPRNAAPDDVDGRGEAMDFSELNDEEIEEWERSGNLPPATRGRTQRPPEPQKVGRQRGRNEGRAPALDEVSFEERERQNNSNGETQMVPLRKIRPSRSEAGENSPLDSDSEDTGPVRQRPMLPPISSIPAADDGTASPPLSGATLIASSDDGDSVPRQTEDQRRNIKNMEIEQTVALKNAAADNPEVRDAMAANARRRATEKRAIEKEKELAEMRGGERKGTRKAQDTADNESDVDDVGIRARDIPNRRPPATREPEFTGDSESEVEEVERDASWQAQNLQNGKRHDSRDSGYDSPGSDNGDDDADSEPDSFHPTGQVVAPPPLLPPRRQQPDEAKSRRAETPVKSVSSEDEEHVDDPNRTPTENARETWKRKADADTKKKERQQRKMQEADAKRTRQAEAEEDDGGGINETRDAGESSQPEEPSRRRDEPSNVQPRDGEISPLSPNNQDWVNDRAKRRDRGESALEADEVSDIEESTQAQPEQPQRQQRPNERNDASREGAKQERMRFGHEDRKKRPASQEAIEEVPKASREERRKQKQEEREKRREAAEGRQQERAKMENREEQSRERKERKVKRASETSDRRQADDGESEGSSVSYAKHNISVNPLTYLRSTWYLLRAAPVWSFLTAGILVLYIEITRQLYEMLSVSSGSTSLTKRATSSVPADLAFTQSWFSDVISNLSLDPTAFFAFISMWSIVCLPILGLLIHKTMTVAENPSPKNPDAWRRNPFTTTGNVWQGLKDCCKSSTRVMLLDRHLSGPMRFFARAGRWTWLRILIFSVQLIGFVLIVRQAMSLVYMVGTGSSTSFSTLPDVTSSEKSLADVASSLDEQGAFAILNFLFFLVLLVLAASWYALLHAKVRLPRRGQTANEKQGSDSSKKWRLPGVRTSLKWLAIMIILIAVIVSLLFFQDIASYAASESGASDSSGELVMLGANMMFFVLMGATGYVVYELEKVWRKHMKGRLGVGGCNGAGCWGCRSDVAV